MIKDRNLELIDKVSLIKSVEYNAHIGGDERLLSLTEVVALIENQRIWERKTIKVI